MSTSLTAILRSSICSTSKPNSEASPLAARRRTRDIAGSAGTRTSTGPARRIAGDWTSVTRLLHRELARRPGDLQQAPHLRAGAAQGQRVAALLGAPGGVEQGPQAGRVDEAHPGQIEHDCALLLLFEQGLAQDRSGGHVDVAIDLEHAGPIRVDLEPLRGELRHFAPL